MIRIRICIGDGAGILHSIIIETLKSEPDMEVRLLRGGASAAIEEACGADVLILTTARDWLPAEWERFMYACPHVSVLSVIDDGRRAALYELRPRAVPVGDVSPQGLVDAIRSAVAAAASEGR